RLGGGRLREQLLRDEDRPVETERERDRIARSGVDRELLATGPLEMEGGEVRVVPEIADDDPVEPGAEALDQLLHQIVRQRAGRGHPLDLERDRLCLEWSDPDRQLAAPLPLLDQAD